MNDESNEKLNYYIKNILSFLKNREQVESPLPPSKAAASAELANASATPAAELANTSLQKANASAKSVFEAIQPAETLLPSKATGKALSSAEVAEGATASVLSAVIEKN